MHKSNNINTVISLTQVQRLLASELANDFKPLGITIDMWITLDTLSTTPDLAMTKIADRLCLNLPTVTKLIDRMVSDNYVYRKPHHQDRRRVLIFPTKRGLTILNEAQLVAADFEQGIFKKTKLNKKAVKGLLAELFSTV